MKRKIMAAALSIVVGFVGALFIAQKEAEAGEVQQGIAKQIIRFHVLANSDSGKDQQLKMKVRDRIVTYMEGFLKNAGTIDDTRNEILAHTDGIRKTAEEVIEKEGYDYSVKVELADCDFPEKVYGDCTFPAGKYEALRVKIGNAGGKNWWCVLYPNLCFMESGRLFVPDEQKEELRQVLTEQEFNEVAGKAKVKIRFKFLDFLNP